MHWEDVSKVRRLERCADCGDDDEIISVLKMCANIQTNEKHQIKPVSINVKSAVNLRRLL